MFIRGGIFKTVNYFWSALWRVKYDLKNELQSSVNSGWYRLIRT